MRRAARSVATESTSVVFRTMGAVSGIGSNRVAKPAMSDPMACGAASPAAPSPTHT